MEKGKIIAIEGCDGAGGETQINLLKERFPNALFLRYPDYNNEIGKMIHRFLHENIELSVDIQFLLFAGDMVKDRNAIKKAIEEGRDVFIDRYFLSTIVYQGLQGFSLENALKFAEIFELPKPDLVIFLKISPETSLKRKMIEKNKNVDRWERDLEWQRKVIERYEDLARKNIFANKWVIIDGEKSKEEVHKEILKEIEKLKGNQTTIERLPNIIIIGQQGSGKGAYAQGLCKKFGYVHISTGDLLREEIKKSSEIGKKIANLVSSGVLVPDEIVTDLLEKKLKEVKAPFILDGYPRTEKQIYLLNEILKKINKKIDLVISLVLPDELSIERIVNRRTCKSCGWVCNIKFMPPKVANKCDKCGGELYQREDDREDIVKKRLEEHHKQVKPILEYYSSLGLVKEIDSSREYEVVMKDIETLIENFSKEFQPSNKKYAIVLLGPPGSGKGTLAKNISEKLNLLHIETGKIIRDEIEKGSEIGLRVKEEVSQGKLVSDEIINSIVKENLKRIEDKNGVIFDGYPRRISQAEALKNMIKVDLVINLVAPEKILIARITGRRTCKNCGEVYNLADINEVIDGIVYRMPPLLPKVANKCDKCGGELYQREDEKEDVVKKRLEEYEKETRALIDYYKNEKSVRFIELHVNEGKEGMIEKAIRVIREYLN
ncbi:MAG: dTMP kinase [Candidatus Aenigmatarchaeota archaeon]